MKTLWLDDRRNPFLDLEGKVPKESTLIHWVLNYDQFIQYIEKFGLPDIISFDHDLAFEHYTPEEYWIDYEKSKEYQEKQEYTEKTGKDCANFLVNYCIDNNKKLPKYYVHSANPVGRDNIISISLLNAQTSCNNSNKHNQIEINQLKIINNIIPNINRGGCGYFAMKLYEGLNNPERYSVVSINKLSHVTLRDNKTGLFIDSNGFVDSSTYKLEYGICRFEIISYDSLKYALRHLEWNPIFDKRDTTCINSFLTNLLK